ncbi:MCE family protein [Acidimicrobiia bacterium EGI L10123]|uniref:MlaD family protein n=1 Tax=Salinilacustrithrix flava TaxID=2957203 RepID=UPI003D7C2224|nr:MCE family protein [Acidimicrobiia bacterium EGI L10123]
MVLDADRTRLAVGLIALVVTGAIASLMVLAANGAYADDYQLTARTTRTGFGLDDTSEIKLRGVKIGTVERVELLHDGAVELVLNIAKDVRIPVDATATIEPLSVFGPKFVDVRPGVNEVDGPFLDPGTSMGAVVEPSELAETLDGVATLLATIDTDDVSTIVSELARGLDGLGEDLGASIDAANDVAARIDTKQPEIDALLAHARALSATLSSRSDSLSTLANDGQELLRTIDEQGDAFGELLVGVSELAIRGDDLLTEVGDDLDPTLIALERGVGVLREQLRFLPDFVDGLDAVSALLGTGLLQWDRGNGQWGGIGHGVLDFAPCGLIADANCPPRPGYHG